MRRPRATHQTARSVKGWGKAKPKTQRERKALAKRCGRRAFMVPKTLAFPVMGKRAKGCKVDCRGLLEAKQRASTHRRKYPGLVKRIDALGKRAKCRWAR